MVEREGVIKFQLEYEPGPPLAAEELRELNAWRRILYLLQLIGQDPHRYDGFGFGNLSRRLPPLDAPERRRPFVISGTQTGSLPELGPEHYTVVFACDAGRNRVEASGPVRPSSEALTHGILYDLDGGLQVVMHAHSPVLWRHAGTLGIPVTSAAVPYGTPEMAAEVRRLFGTADFSAGPVFAMGGHEDGVVAFGRSAEEAGTALLRQLARALALDR